MLACHRPLIPDYPRFPGCPKLSVSKITIFLSSSGKAGTFNALTLVLFELSLCLV